MKLFLAAIQVAPSTPAPAPGAAPATPPPATVIHDIVPPVDVFPYPTWMVVTAISIAALLLGLIVWLAWRYWPRQPPPPPPTPREIALAALERLRLQVESLIPYAFSIEVSTVLRRYIEDQYSLRALEQTSPEFLAAIARSPRFSEDDRYLLETFLNRCDMIKFARLEADSTVSKGLFDSAIDFVRGGIV